MRHDGSFPPLLVFGVIPSFTCPNTKTANQTERFEALHPTEVEMEKVVAETRIKRALKSKLPPATKFLINPGNQVRI